MKETWWWPLTYLLTPWSRVLLEKLASLQLVKKFPAFYGTRRFLTALTSARHLSLSWASPIQSSYPNPTSWRSILMLSSHLRLGLPSGSLSCGMKLPPEAFPPGDPSGGVVYLRIVFSPEEASRPYEWYITGGFLRRGVVSTSPNPQPRGPWHPF